MVCACGCCLVDLGVTSDEWSSDYSIPSTVGLGAALLPCSVPMPTLYSGAEGGGRNSKPPKLSIIELVLYNMAAMLAGVAAGYDVRLSNVSPVHPRLQPHRLDTGSELVTWRGPPVEYDEFAATGTSNYSHNTYHGNTKHQRPALSGLGGAASAQLMALQKPLRFTDSPQHCLSTVPPGHVTPRRKSSSTSNDGSEPFNVNVNAYRKDSTGYYNTYERVPGIYIPGDYNIPPVNDLTGGANLLYGGSYCARSDGLRTETNLAFNYGSEFSSRNDFASYSGNNGSGSDFTNIHYNASGAMPTSYQESSSDLSYSHSHPYDNQSSANSTTISHNWTPARFGMAHHRTPSNVSNASSTNTNNSNVNPNFRLDDEVVDYPPHTSSAYNTPTHYYHRRPSNTEYEYNIKCDIPLAREHFSRQNSHESNTSERPGTLDIGVTKLRSSLKRYNYASGGSSKCSPETPPDSFTSDDASFVSARGDSSQSARVRFSPETMLLDLPSSSQNHEPPGPLGVSRKTPATPSNITNDLEKDFVL